MNEVVLDSKRAYRLRLAALPIMEKLLLLEELRQRQLEILLARKPQNPV